MRVLWAGTFDPEFSRNRRLLEMFEHLPQVDLTILNRDIWPDDRAERPIPRARDLMRMIGALAQMLWRVGISRNVDVVLITYPGWFDAVLVGAIARLRGWPVVYDPFIGLVETVVEDRALMNPGSALARSLALVERIGLRLATVVLADTGVHGRYYSECAGAALSVEVLPVGAEEDVFKSSPEPALPQQGVLFYGSYVPLHGVDTILEAASFLPDVHFRLIGEGQDRSRIEARVRREQIENVEFLGVVPLRRLQAELAACEIALGIFGASAKAARVVPHKVFEAAAMGRPIITARTPSIIEMFGDSIVTVDAGDARAVARAIERLRTNDDLRSRLGHEARAAFLERASGPVLVRQLGLALIRAADQ